MTQQPATRRQNTEQQRGAQAWTNIGEIKEIKKQEGGDLESDYRSLARGLNAMIQINGLGQTLGYLNAKGAKEWREKHKKNAHFYLLGHLSHWMHDHFDQTIPDTTDSKNNGLLDWVLRESTSSADYRRATTECLAFGNWLRRFAEAELEGEA